MRCRRAPERTRQREAQEAQATDEVRRMITGLIGRKLMIGVDRLDYSKGLVNRFNAYDRFLETHPDNLSRITYLQIAPLSRADLRAYSRLRRELEQTAGRINGNVISRNSVIGEAPREAAACSMSAGRCSHTEPAVRTTTARLNTT